MTGKGIDDIKNGIIRTPLNPDITYKEDPLRMMRAIRIAVKYDFKLNEDVIESIKKKFRVN